MAYTVTMTKEGVSKAGNGILSISMGMTVNDGTSDVFQTSMTAKYNPNSGDLNAFKAAIQTELKERWDKWAAEKAILDSAALDTVLGQIQTAANTYVNA
jgi:hypothetical protein